MNKSPGIDFVGSINQSINQFLY